MPAGFFAILRLQARGLVVSHRRGTLGPTLSVAPAWDPPEYLHPERLWKQPWEGIWFTLAYDIAEADRPHRVAVKRWLQRLRCGCLQRSVWITPRDIRADFADLLQATGMGPSVYLLESRVAAGHGDADMVRQAWDWERLGRQNDWFLPSARECRQWAPRRPSRRRDCVGG
jgi:DNA-binding transcriptional regulator PaaX